MMEVEGGIENPYDIGGHLKIPVKTPKVRLVKVYSFSIQDILWNLTLRHFSMWVSLKHPCVGPRSRAHSVRFDLFLLRQVWQRSLWHLIRGRPERSGWSFVCSQACLSSAYSLFTAINPHLCLFNTESWSSSDSSALVKAIDAPHSTHPFSMQNSFRWWLLLMIYLLCLVIDSSCVNQLSNT